MISEEGATSLHAVVVEAVEKQRKRTSVPRKFANGKNKKRGGGEELRPNTLQ